MDSVGPYRLDALVGRGTAGAVWRATRAGPVDQVVAVKRAGAATGDEGAERLRLEATILTELDHPHIVRVLDVLDDGPGVAIVMSFARGGSLHDLLAERGRLSPGQTVAVLSRVADALGSAHRRGVFHGDVKPANILFTTDGEPLLGDFGVAQHLTPGLAGLDGIGGLRSVEGTVGYVDPALVETGRPDPRNDVYGLAVVAYLALTGRLPHVGDDVRAVLGAAEVGAHPSLVDHPGISRPLAELVESALDRDPDARPATAEAFAAGLRSAVPADEVALPGVAAAPAATSDDGGAGGCGVPAVDAGSSDEALRPPSVEGVAPPPADRGTRAFGPRPPRPDEAAPRGRPVLAGLTVLALVAVAVGGGLWLRARLADDQSPTSVAVAGGGAPRGVECADLPPLEVPPGAQELRADLGGDGCPVQVVWDGRVMRFRLDASDAEPRSFQFDPVDGGPGQLVIGDWDCDGAETPAFYQPATGRVAYFSEVPERVRGEVDAQLVETDVREGRARVDAGGSDDGCDEVAVEPEA